MNTLRGPFFLLKVNTTSNRLFIAFAGNAQRLMMDPLVFFRDTGIAKHNLMFIRDPKVMGYRDGVSNDICDMPSLRRWIQMHLESSFQHISEIFIIGTSSGGYPALALAPWLHAQCVWTFGARICKHGAFQYRDSRQASMCREILNRDQSSQLRTEILSAEELALCLKDATCRKALWECTENPVHFLDWPLIQSTKEQIQNNPATQYRLFFSPQNLMDATLAFAFRSCPRTLLFPILDHHVSSDDLDCWGRSRSHVVVRLLQEQGSLRDVFRDAV